MGRSNETFSKKEKEKKKRKKKEEKAKRREERKAQGTNSFEDMIAYVDEFGNIVDTPPDKDQKEEIDSEDIVLGVPKKGEVEDVPDEGKVSYFDSSKGYGFIMHDHTADKHFFHISNCIDEVQENDKVTFDLEVGQKGKNAVNVKKK